MSRDAKVGLVIVFAFVFLLGTILVHRMQGNSAANSATAEADMKDFPPGDESDDAPPATATGVTSSSFAANATIVDAQPADNLTPPPNRGVFKPPLTTPRQEPSRTNNAANTSTRTNPFIASRPDESGDSGAHIALTEPDGDRQPAAVVERRGAGANPFGSKPSDSSDSRSSGLDVPEHHADSPHRAAPLLDIRGRPQDPPADESDSSPLVKNDSTTEPESSATGTIDKRRMPTDDPPDRIVGRTTPQLDTPPVSNPPELEEPDSPFSAIQPAAGDRRPGSKDTTTPRLPKFGEPPEPKIEAVPDRGMPLDRGASHSTPGNERRTSPPADDSSNSRPARSNSAAPEPTPTRTNGERTYTVKSGDSFWSISAKQYGTGKYFRALEDYNYDRLVTPGGDPKPGEKHLVPGITIMLPDVSVLKMRTTPKAAIPAAREPGASPGRDASPVRDQSPPASRDSRTSARQPDAPAQASQATATRPTSGSGSVLKPGVHVVEEGDTLSTIALRKLGTSKRWDEIYRLNQDRIADPNRLKIGTELKLPAASAENAADRPRGGR